LSKCSGRDSTPWLPGLCRPIDLLPDVGTLSRRARGFSPGVFARLAEQVGISDATIAGYDWHGRTGRRHCRLILELHGYSRRRAGMPNTGCAGRRSSRRLLSGSSYTAPHRLIERKRQRAAGQRKTKGRGHDPGTRGLSKDTVWQARLGVVKAKRFAPQKAGRFPSKGARHGMSTTDDATPLP
jgi:hypothetical protein